MRYLALIVLAVLALAAPAQAKPHRMTFQFATAVAADYWNQRLVRVPCHPQQELLTDAETKDWGYGTDMVTDVPTCTVEVTPWAEWWRTDRDNKWLYCREIVHEIGHLAGLEHDHGGVMDPDANVTPWGCSHPRMFRRYWANRSILKPFS